MRNGACHGVKRFRLGYSGAEDRPHIGRGGTSELTIWSGASVVCPSIQVLCITNPGIVMPLLKMAFPLSRGAASQGRCYVCRSRGV